MRPGLVSSDPFSEDASAVNPIEPTANYFWDNDPTSGNCALRGRNGEVLRVIIQSGSTWFIWQDDVLDGRATRKEARDRALEMWLKAGR